MPNSDRSSASLPRFMPVKDAAEYLSISQRQVRRLIVRNELPAYKIAGEALRVRTSDLESLIIPVNTAGGAR